MKIVCEAREYVFSLSVNSIQVSAAQQSISSIHSSMGGGASKAKIPPRPVRLPGDFLNLQGYRAEHEVVIPPPFGRSHKQAICRCWLSKRFPMCDNTHQKLNKIGCEVGPAVLEVLPVD